MARPLAETLHILLNLELKGMVRQMGKPVYTKIIEECIKGGGALDNRHEIVEGIMAKYLVIVESPAKAKTINKFLGSNYQVVASNGHVRDLPKSQLGIDIENDFEPKYITIRGKGDILAMLRKEVKKADKVYLATDPDREGEAISWHLANALKLEGKQVHRITFNEITRRLSKARSNRPEILIWIWWMPSRPGEFLTGWWDIRSVRCYGQK